MADNVPAGRPEIDPICGMTVDPEHAAGTSQRNGKTVYFCSLSCKERFDADPRLKPR